MSGYGNVRGALGSNSSQMRRGTETKVVLASASFARTLQQYGRDRRGGGMSPKGLAHVLGVCLLEGVIAMGRGKGVKTGVKGTMPQFVDVRLTVEQRAEFSDAQLDARRVTDGLFSLVSEGYRVGIGYSGETQAFTVSLTGRETGTPNDGLCMTSFAGDALTACALALYKHHVVCECVWGAGGNGNEGLFG